MTRRKMLKWNQILLLLILLSDVQSIRRSRSVRNCPQNCNCGVFNNDKTYVNCTNRELTNVPQDIAKDITRIVLSRNDIGRIGGRDFNQMVQLKSLDLSRNRIEAINGRAFDTDHLEWLDLSYNPLSNISLADLGQSARSIVTLNISNTNIRNFPMLRDDGGRFMTQFKRLAAANNLYRDIPHGRIPPTTEFIDISCLEMPTLYSRTFHDLLQLKEIIIQGCWVQRIKLTSIEEGAFQNMRSLERLDLRGNALIDVPRGMPTYLVVLNLSYNSISRLKVGPCASPRDVNVATSDSHLIREAEREESSSIVGSTLSTLTNLRELDLSHNNIYQLCIDDFVFMQGLKKLNISNSSLNRFHPETFVHPSNLEVLDLSHNSLIALTTHNLFELKEIYVQGNLIAKIQNDTNLVMPSLLVADFSNNPYRCDCHLTGFVRFFQTSSVTYLNTGPGSYACSSPLPLRGKPLFNVAFSDLKCTESIATGIPPWAVATPAALGGLIIVVIVVVVVVVARRKGHLRCFDTDTKKVVSKFTKYDEGSDIVIKNDHWKDAAILCHENNQKWILNAMIPKLHRHTQSKNSNDNDVSILEINSEKKSLNIDVFSVGKTIRIDRLSNCIDSNRKIVLIVTFEFLGEASCVYILETIHARMKTDPKESVIIVLLDATPWQDMPVALQRLMVEKSFVQFPQDDRRRQEFYFWDTLCALVCRTPESGPKRNWLDTEVSDLTTNLPPPRRVERLDDDVTYPGDTIRSSRRANPDEFVEPGISAKRAARLRRLGIDKNGDVVCQSHRSPPNPTVPSVSNPKRDDPLITKPSSFDQPVTATTVSTIKRKDDIKEESNNIIENEIDYSSRNRRGNVHSLLPPSFSDVASIYSQDEIEKSRDVRPRGRDARGREQRPESRSKRNKQRIERKSRLPPNEFENLHGTVAPPVPEHDEERPQVEQVETEQEVETPVKRKQSKLLASVTRIKSWF